MRSIATFTTHVMLQNKLIDVKVKDTTLMGYTVIEVCRENYFHIALK